MQLDLSNITLCVADCRVPDLAARAISKSQIGCKFFKSILFTDRTLNHIDQCEIKLIDSIKSIDDYSLFILKELHNFVETDYVLIAQWDGYVVEPQSWQLEFLNCDYIGARWQATNHSGNVGNGGFSLRSKKLLQITASSAFHYTPGEPEDVQICSTNKALLEKDCSIKFADRSIADAFSYEQILPDKPTFGFHGVYNLLRHNDDQELLEIFKKLPSNAFADDGYVRLLLEYFSNRNLKMTKIIYDYICKASTPRKFIGAINEITKSTAYAEHVFRLCRIL